MDHHLDIEDAEVFTLRPGEFATARNELLARLKKAYIVMAEAERDEEKQRAWQDLPQDNAQVVVVVVGVLLR